MIIANMATFPGRADVLEASINRIIPQVDKLNLCLNEYKKIPEYLKTPKINAFIPDDNYRDVGKFVCDDFQADDDVLYIDDDIIYPENYVVKMQEKRGSLALGDAIVGVHGVIYPDVYDGSVGSRVVFAFKRKLLASRRVNQLGTGTILCKGYQAAPLSFMNGSQRYVDVRYARYCLNNKWPQFCVNREDGWMSEIEHEVSIFNEFTKKWPDEVIKECQEICGYSKL